MYLVKLNTIYFTLIKQKAHRTYKHILEGAYVFVLWSGVVEETRVPEENHQPFVGQPLPCWHRESIPGCSDDKWESYPWAIQALYMYMYLVTCIVCPEVLSLS